MMRLAAYALLLSALYAFIAVVSADVARELTIGFVAAIVVPAVAHDIQKGKRRRSSDG